MTKEQIEQAAMQDSLWFAIRDGSRRTLYMTAFTKGAEWRINSVWNDKKDIPEEHRDILVKFIDDDGVHLWVEQYNKEYNCLDNSGIDWDGVLRWAYVEDLLPM